MRRLFIVLLIAAGATAAAVLPRPEPPPEPLAGLVIDDVGIDSPVDASIWYCPWIQSNAERDSFVAVASIVPAEAQFTFPVAIPGEPPDTAEAATLGPGAAGVTLSEVAQRGDSPGFVEFSDGPSAATVTVIGDVVTADACVSQGPTEWFFVGGSTMNSELLTLRLFNPFPETAKVTVTGFSEVGVEALGELRSVSVNPRSWRDIAFDELLRQRQSLALSVRLEEGLVVPAMSFGLGEGDEAWWGGTGLSSAWELPVTRAEGLDAELVIANPGLASVEVTVDLYGEATTIPGAFVMTIPPESPLRISLGEVADQILGARVQASGQVTASVVASGEAGTALTAGVPVLATDWLVPGLRSAGLDQGTLWLLNTSEDPVAVTVSALTGSEAFNTRHVIEPGRVLRVPAEGEDALGYLVSSPNEFSAAWTVVGPAGIAYASALPVAQG